jgi:hypothetical protein
MVAYILLVSMREVTDVHRRYSSDSSTKSPRDRSENRHQYELDALGRGTHLDPPTAVIERQATAVGEEELAHSSAEEGNSMDTLPEIGAAAAHPAVDTLPSTADGTAETVAAAVGPACALAAVERCPGASSASPPRVLVLIHRHRASARVLSTRVERDGTDP